MPREFVSTTMEVEDGESLRLIGVEGFVDYDLETDFGSDADGKRGESRTIVNEVQEVTYFDPETHEIIFKPFTDHKKYMAWMEKAEERILEKWRNNGK